MLHYIPTMKGYNVPLHELAPTNGRSADAQAFYYGYDSAADLAADLPPNANVIDVGAGISNFGRVIAYQRPDVSVTYFDLRYDNPYLLNQAMGEDSPPNVSYVKGDILDISEGSLLIESFNRAYSSRLIPHIELEDAGLARNAILNIGQLLKTDGYMMLLCRFYPLLRDKLLCHPAAIRIMKQELLENPDLTLEHAISAIRLPDIHRWWQKVNNVHATAHYGQARWRQPDEKGRIFPMRGDIWDRDQQTFVPRRSWRGHVMYTGFLRRIINDPFPQRVTQVPSPQFVLLEVARPALHYDVDVYCGPSGRDSAESDAYGNLDEILTTMESLGFTIPQYLAGQRIRDDG